MARYVTSRPQQEQARRKKWTHRSQIQRPDDQGIETLGEDVFECNPDLLDPVPPPTGD